MANAQAWTQLVRQHHHHSGPLRPNWRAITQFTDAIHLRPAAVCAIDGMSLTSELGPLAPTYWTVETTFWLRWRFDDDIRAIGVEAAN